MAEYFPFIRFDIVSYCKLVQLEISRINPRWCSYSANSSDTRGFLTSTSNVCCKRLSDTGNFLNELSWFNLFFYDSELSQAKLRTGEVHITASIAFSWEESVDLHSFAKDYIVSTAIILPEAFSCGATSSSLLINNECCIRLTSNAN